MKKYALHVAFALTAIACIYAYFQFLKPLDVFLWDESHHGYFGMQIFNDLREADFGAFWAHTNNQALWMPLHSWFDGIFLLIFGFSYSSARLSSLFLFFICSMLIFFTGLELSKEKGWIIGFIACALFLSSPMMLHLATVNMQEMLGIFICVMTLWFIVKYISNEAPWKYATIGFLLSVAYWSKTNFAIQLVFGAALYQLSKIDPGRLKQWMIDNSLIILGFLPLFVLWWATPPFERKYGLGFIFRAQGMQSPSFSPVAGFFNALGFYFQSLLSSYSFSFWIGLGSLAAFLASFWFYREKKIRIISLMFLANLLFISYISSNNIQERYLSTSIPFVFLLLAYFAVLYFDRIRESRSATAYYVIFAFLFSAVAYDSLSLTRYTKEVANRTILSFIYKESLNKFSPPFLFGLAKRPAFTYPADQPKKYRDFKVPPSSTIRDVLDFFSSNIERNRSISTMISFNEISPYVIYWHFHDWGAYVMSLNDLAANPQYFWLSDYFLDIEPSEDSPYYPDRIEKRWDDIGRMLLREGAIKLAAKKEFADLGLTARIYKRQKTFYFR